MPMGMDVTERDYKQLGPWEKQEWKLRATMKKLPTIAQYDSLLPETGSEDTHNRSIGFPLRTHFRPRENQNTVHE